MVHEWEIWRKSVSLNSEAGEQLVPYGFIRVHIIPLYKEKLLKKRFFKQNVPFKC